jgi:uroporphyrinogen decarboxylase
MGSVDDVKRETDNLLQIFADNPRFILNAGCAIPPHTPPENIKAMIQAVQV